MKTFLENVRIEAISAVLPSYLQELDEEFLGINENEISKITKITGISKVAIASHNTTASDLCINATKLIFDSVPSYHEEIDVIIFVSQSRDYILPSTSSIIQEKLGMNKHCLCLDIPSGCTGYVQGLFVASSMLASNSCKKVLLLCGETNSKLINQQDKSVSMIFGDGGSATILGRSLGHKSFFNFNTDGSNYDKIIMPDGGCRNPFNSDSLSSKLHNDGNIRRPLDMMMDGMSVFNFTLTAVPELVNETLEDCCIAAGDLDLFAAHQANELIVRQLAKKCGLSEIQSPFLAGNYGNTGPVSIPLMLCSGFHKSSTSLSNVLMCGFGVGLNWGTCLTNLSFTRIYPIKINN